MHLTMVTWSWQVSAAEALKGQVHLRAIHVFRFFRSISAHTESPYQRYTSILNLISCVSRLRLISHECRYPLLISLAMPS